MVLTGFGLDLAVSCALFLLAIIPSHVHGFYVSCTYFHRCNKVRKGRYPGGPKAFIDSEEVIRGGASASEVERLRRRDKKKDR